MNVHVDDDAAFDTRIRSFLDWVARDVAVAPSAREMALRIEGVAPRTRAAVVPRLGWGALVGLLLAALLGAVLLAGVGWSRPDPVAKPVTWEAVVLRLEVAGDGFNRGFDAVAEFYGKVVRFLVRSWLGLLAMMEKALRANAPEKGGGRRGAR